MSFLAPRPNIPQSTTAATANQIPSFQGAQPMTLALGHIPYQGARWLCDAYNRHTASGGKTAPAWQYADIAASFGIGPMRWVGRVRINGTVIANVDHTRTTEDYIDYTFNASLASGEAWWMRFYFGTETQTADASLAAGTGQTHPAYRGEAYAVFHNMDLGAGQTSIQSIEIECGNETPAIDTFAATLNGNTGVNPIAAIYALFTTNYGGLGADSSLLDPVHWGAQAAALEATGIARRTGALTYLHAVLTSFSDIASVVSEWLAYFDGYLYQRDGKLCIGWMPHAAVDPTTLPQITEADLTALPSGGGFPDANAGLSDAIVTYLDSEREYTQQGATYRAPANRKTQVAASPAQVDRPLCHNADQASYIVAEVAATGPQQEPSTQLSVLRSRAVRGDGSPLLPGDLFNYDYNPETLDLVCRVTERIETDPAGPVQLTVIRERGVYPTPHVPAHEDRVLPTEDAPGEATSSNVRLWFLPSGFGATPQVAALINRPVLADIGALLHLSTAGTAPWEVILDQRYFVAKCAISTSNINSSVATVRVSSSSLDFARMPAQSTVGQADDTLCLLIGDELMSVGTIAVVSAGVYDLGLLRGRKGSAAAAHVIGDAAWLFLRAELASATHAEFSNIYSGGVYNATVATKYFKTQLFTVDAEGDAKPDDPGISLTLPDPTPAAPTFVSESFTHASDGTALGRVLVALPALGTGAVSNQLLYQTSGATAWELVGEVAAAGNLSVSDLAPGATYLFAVRAVNGSGVFSPVSSPLTHTVGADDTVPEVTSDPSANANPGYIAVAWDASGDAFVSEFYVYRNTSATTVGATLLGITSNNWFDDASAVPGTAYAYWVKAVSRTGILSAFSGDSGLVTALTAPVGAAVPGSPTAATRVTPGSDDTYQAADGSIFAFITLNVPSLPANAVWLEVGLRRNGASGDYLTWGQLKAANATFRIDDLSPGIVYDLATRAWSGAGGSAWVAATSSPFTAPTKTTGPGVVTSASMSAAGTAQIPVSFVGPARCFGTLLTWTNPSDPDLDHLEVKGTYYDTDGDTNYTWMSPQGLFIPAGAPGTVQSTPLYTGTTLPPGFVRIRSVNRSGVASAWVRVGNAGSYATLPAGDMASQASNAVTVNGISTGDTSASSVRKVIARYQVRATITLAGGAPTENVNIDLTNRGFSTKPDVGLCSLDQCPVYGADYVWNIAGSTSTNAVVQFKSYSGANLAAGSYILLAEFIEYY